MVHTDTHSRVVLLTDIDEGHELLLNLFELGSILFVGIFQMLEGAAWIHIVARVDTYLLAVLCCYISGMSSKVYVSHQRCVVAVGLQSGRDILHILCLANPLSCKTYQFATGINNTLGLSYRTFCIIRIGGGHRLDADGIITTNGYVAYMGHATNSSCTHISPQLNPCWLFQSCSSGHSCRRSDAEPEPHHSMLAFQQLR